MKILIVGSGGREHALAWKTAQSEHVTEIIVAPGNVGIAGEPKCRLAPVSAEDVKGLVNLAVAERVDLAVVGPEAPLVMGLADVLRQSGIMVFGPSGKAAEIEGSKAFSKELMARHGIPSGDFAVFNDYEKARSYLLERSGPLVVKADGLAAGKGVIVCRTTDESLGAIDLIMRQRAFGDAGNRVVVEEFMDGEEASFIAFSDGKTVLPLAGSQDHKPVFDNDQGPNTGGMGAYSPAPVITPEIHDRIMNEIMIPTVRAMENEGFPYVGFLYAGLMIKDGIPRVLEFNCRMGDPEAQPLVFRMKSDIVPPMWAAAEGKLAGTTIEWEPNDSVCVVMASGGYPGSYEKGRLISGLEDADKIEGVKVFHAGTATNDQGFVTSGGRVLGVTAKGADIKQAVELAYRAVRRISWEGVQYRKDIGRRALLRLERGGQPDPA
jgi:phosphoribosylamine---glycine ligase